MFTNIIFFISERLSYDSIIQNEVIQTHVFVCKVIITLNSNAALTIFLNVYNNNTDHSSETHLSLSWTETCSNVSHEVIQAVHWETDRQMSNSQWLKTCFAEHAQIFGDLRWSFVLLTADVSEFLLINVHCLTCLFFHVRSDDHKEMLHFHSNAEDLPYIDTKCTCCSGRRTSNLSFIWTSTNKTLCGAYFNFHTNCRPPVELQKHCDIKLDNSLFFISVKLCAGNWKYEMCLF